MSDLATFVEPLQLDLLARLFLAVFLGALIGLEREWAGKSAGLRTTTLICLGSALFTEVSINTATMVETVNSAAGVVYRADPARIAANIVTGVGFLGGGAILRSGNRVIGLTTAATIWVVAAVGVAVGSRSYVLAIGSTALILFILFPLRRMERFLAKRVRRQPTVAD